ncbi:MAG: PAS domain S-box protein [Spirochaetes bacterium]|jgi:PAS domain S-box-containing protein|nr:PAS domain S-box protein [Spirochaetota bacterium]
MIKKEFLNLIAPFNKGRKRVIKRAIIRFFPQALSIQTKIFLLCSLVVVLSVVTLSSAFLLITIQRIHKDSRGKILKAGMFIARDLNHKKDYYSRATEELLANESLFENSLINYAHNPEIISSRLYITGLLKPVSDEFRKFAQLSKLTNLRLYTYDRRLLAHYTTLNKERRTSGLYIKSQSGRDTYLDLSEKEDMLAVLFSDEPIDFTPLPRYLSDSYKKPFPRNSEVSFFTRKGRLGIQTRIPLLYLTDPIGLLVAEYTIDDADTKFYKKFTETEVNFFSEQRLSSGTLEGETYSFNNELNDLLTYDSDTSSIEMNKVYINNALFYQHQAALMNGEQIIGHVSLNIRYITEKFLILKTILLVLGVAITVLLITFGLTVYFSRPGIKFIHNLIKSTTAVASGKLNQTIPIHTHDELGVLAISFKNMRDAILQKITEQKRLVAILENTSDMICMYRNEKKILYMNSSLKKLFPNTELSAINLTQLYPEWARDLLEHEGYFEASRNGTWHGESAILSREGKEIPVSQVIVCHTRDDASIDYFSTIMRDISERKKNENLIKQNEENLSITLNSIGDAVVVTDNNGTLVRMNPVAEKLTGWDNNSATGLPLEDIFKIVNVNERTTLENPVLQVIKDRKIKTLETDTLLLSRDGKEYRISDSAAPIIREDGSLLGVVLVFRDETEKIRNENQLIQSQKMEAVGTLAGGLAHDFNNVLSGIIGTASLLKNRLLNEEETEKDLLLNYISLIEQSGEQAASIVRQLLTISHKQDFVFTTIDLNRSIKTVVEMAKTTFDRSVNISTTYLDTPALINADNNQIEQVFLNLCINATHAMTTMRPKGDQWGGSLTITLTQTDDPDGKFEDGLIKITIQDTGVGIKKSDMEKIFTPFFTTKDKGKGSGLGLSMVYNIISKHRGSIHVYSEENSGTTISILFPRIGSSTAPRPKKHKKMTIEKGSGLILVIDDEEILRTTSQAMLEECGYQVITAHTGDEGIKLYTENRDKINGIILDMIMPGMSGKETFEKLKEIDPSVKVILSSGFKHDERIQSVMESGILDFIQKPYSLPELSAKIKNMFNL